ncbi:probable methyltransferase TARBP1 isoform X2 [Amyelois transitella]|nr:probable methyltransferase TARBP1 isoform X2 [Amyelois transitella]
MIEILHDPKYQVTSKDTATHFNFQIQYSAISVLSKIKHEDIYRTITSFFLNKIDILMMNKQRYHGNSQCHRSLLLCLQHLLFLFSLTNLECGIENWCEDLLGKLPHQQSVRVCLEWLIALFYYKKGVEINQEFIDHLDAKKIPLTSQFIIIYNIMKRKCNNCSEREYNFVLHHLLGNTMGPMYNVRLYAQCISKQLYKLRESSEHKYMIKIVEQNCAKDKNCARLEEDFFLSRFDILSELKPSFIYHFVPNYTEANNDKIYMELINEELKIMNRNNEGQLNDEEIFKFKYPKGKAKSVESFDGTGSIQKKYVPWGSMSDIEVYGISKKKENPSELIVIASLIDKLPNLGGMARTSEVFGVRTYVIDSLRHLQDSQFQALSVSAERWVNIEEVRPGPPLKAYIQSKKLEGYSIVAAEQTSTSCQLDKFKFDRKTVLLLGHEKEGVPCDLLPLMERCVEVPQRGVVRSLNVHVTAAIFVWEYTRQLLL